MSNELVLERRAFLKKRFRSSSIQLYALLCLTVFNCIAELFFPSFVLPASFYLPQFAANMAAIFSDRPAISALCIIACVALLALIASCLMLARKNYRLVSVINLIVSLDIVLLIYIGIQSLFLKGFQPFFLINLFLHVWLIALVTRLRRASEGLEVLPDEENE